MKYHSIQVLLDSIWNAGHTPQIVVDATHKDVVVPESIRARWKDALPIDLDPKYPLNIDFSKVGISADLAFQGLVSRCFIPWAQIIAVLDRSTGRGNLTRRTSEPVAEPEASKAGLSLVKPVLESEVPIPVPTPTSTPVPARGWIPKVIKGGKA